MTNASSAVNRAEVQQLYRLWGADDELLYIGISYSAVARMSGHRADKPWWTEVVKITVETVRCTREGILAIERDAILSEQPKYNVVHGTYRPQRRHVDRRIPVEVGSMVALGLENGRALCGQVEFVYRNTDIPEPHVQLLRASGEQINILWSWVWEYLVSDDIAELGAFCATHEENCLDPVVYA